MLWFHRDDIHEIFEDRRIIFHPRRSLWVSLRIETNFRKEANLHAELCCLLTLLADVTFKSFLVRQNTFESCYLKEKESNYVKAKLTDALNYLSSLTFFSLWIEMNFRKEAILRTELCYLLTPFADVTFNSFFEKLNAFEFYYLKEKK